MIPVDLRSPRLRLDQPGPADIDLIAEYCVDPLFERYLTTPWPYERKDAEFFVGDFVPRGWATGAEFTWAMRASGVFVGVIGVRTERQDVGFWLGAPFRGLGYMSEALDAVADLAFTRLGFDALRWECLVGNTASAATARAVGFAYTGEAPARVPARDGSAPPAWHGILRPGDARSRTAGWPIP